jgi:protein-disulfide isomerase
VPFALVALFAIGVPIGLAAFPSELTYARVARGQSTDGRLVLREFIDLQCPYCRLTVKALAPILAERPDIRIERHHVPLSFHEHAMEGAVAACCAAEQGAEDRFVEAVVSMEGPPTSANCRSAAQQLGLDLSKFDDCAKSARPLVRIDADKKLFTEAHVRGLPAGDLDGETFVGALDDAKARALFAKHPMTAKK